MEITSALVISSAIYAVLIAAPLSDNKVPVRLLCLPFTDERLGDFLQLGCSVKYQSQDETPCALVDSCPTEPPTDQEELMSVWQEWQRFLETGNIPDSKTSDNSTVTGSGISDVINPFTVTVTTTVVPTPSASSARITHSKCLRYRRSAVDLYKRMGCLVKKSRRCTTIESCPSACESGTGEFHQLNSAPWFEGDNKQCECANIRAVRAFIPRIPRNGMPFPPYKFCYTYGCIVPENEQYVRPNEQVVRANGAQCVCAEGAGPKVQDDAPPFHLDCGTTAK